MAEGAPTTRKDTLLGIVIEILNELSGNRLTGDDPTATLLELGFDSLMLTQASQLLQRKFKVAITFRQLMGELSTPASLAEALDKALPAGQWEPSGQNLPQRPPQERQVQPQTDSKPDLEQILKDQLQVTSQLLAWVKTHGTPGSSLDDSNVPQTAGSSTSGLVHQSHGPFRPIETHARRH